MGAAADERCSAHLLGQLTYAGCIPSFPTKLLHLPAGLSGLGLPHLSTYINNRKWYIAQSALGQKRTTASAVENVLDRGCEAGAAVTSGIEPISFYAV